MTQEAHWTRGRVWGRDLAKRRTQRCKTTVKGPDEKDVSDFKSPGAKTDEEGLRDGPSREAAAINEGDGKGKSVY